MKHLVSFCMTLMMVVAGAACAQKTATSESSTTRVQTHHVGQCKFEVGNLYGGLFSDGKESGGYTGLRLIDNPVFVVYCHAGASQDAVDEQLDIKQVNGQTVWTGTGQPFVPTQHFKVTKFAGKKWAGTATSYDDTTGEESTRGRTFLFCLVENQGPQVLCGIVQSLPSLTIDAKYTHDRIQQVLAVLKTIEFVDAPAQPPALSGASNTH